MKIKSLQEVFLVFLTVVFFSGCAGMGIPIFDPTDYVRDYTPRQVDWTRAPLSVARTTARLDLELQEAQRRYDAAKNAIRDEARAAARYGFKLEQGARTLGELDFYRRRQPR